MLSQKDKKEIFICTNDTYGVILAKYAAAELEGLIEDTIVRFGVGNKKNKTMTYVKFSLPWSLYFSFKRLE